MATLRNERSRTVRDPYDVVSRAVIYTAMAVIAVSWLADVVGFDARGVVPGFDPMTVFWAILLAGLAFRIGREVVHRHRVANHRFCLDCRTELHAAHADADGRGECPNCGRAFSLVSHRHPEEARGGDFHGYHTQGHFKRAMYRAAERIAEARGAVFERRLIGYGWLALGATFVVFSLSVTGGTTGWPATLFVPMIAGLSIWSAVYAARMQRMRSSIIARRLCLDCGYSLLGTPTDAEGVGNCPECHAEFSLAQYEPPRAKRPA